MRTFVSGLYAGCALGALLLLQACGGEGAAVAANSTSIDTGCYATSTVATITPVSPIVAGTGTVVVTGVALYASVPNNTVTGALVAGALDYSNITNKPVRAATVQAETADKTVLASTSTSESGVYTLNVPVNTVFRIRLLPELRKALPGATWSVAVRDNTLSGEPLQTVVTSLTTTGVALSFAMPNIVASSGWNGSTYNSTLDLVNPRAAGPFAILDTIYSGMKLVTSVKPTTQFPALTVYWSPKNRRTSGDYTLGEIGNTFFGTVGTCTNPLRAIFVLGKEGLDTDEYDSGVVAHEYGHYLQSAFSINHSLGGAHGSGDKLDMTLAFSEGWGNAFSSMARSNPIYTDSNGPGQTSGFAINLASLPGTTAVSRGWYSEDSVGASLYSLFAGSSATTAQGFGSIWAALTGPMKTSQNGLATIFSFSEAVRSASVTVGSALNSLLTTQNIATGVTADQWGVGETNNGGSSANLPVYTTLTLGSEAISCFSSVNLTGASINKLGTVKYFRVNLPGAGLRTVRSNFSQGGHNIDFEVFQKGVLRGEAQTYNAGSEIGSLYLAAGEAVIRLVDNNVATASATNCATIRID
jgi:Fungalysin metallopeptidase (M36)